MFIYRVYYLLRQMNIDSVGRRSHYPALAGFDVSGYANLTCQALIADSTSEPIYFCKIQRRLKRARWNVDLGNIKAG